MTAFLEEVAKTKLVATDGSVDEAVYQQILGMRELRDIFVDYLGTKLTYSSDAASEGDGLFSLLEGLLNLFQPINGSQLPSESQDGFRFLARELILCFVACALRLSRDGILCRLFDEQFVLDSRGDGPKLRMFVAFDGERRSIDVARNARLKLNRSSLTADLIKERVAQRTPSFNDLMEADLLLSLRSGLHFSNYRSVWRPVTLVFAESDSAPFRLFLKGWGPRVAGRLLNILGCASPEEFLSLFEEWRNRSNGFQHFVPGDGWGVDVGRWVAVGQVQALVGRGIKAAVTQTGATGQP